MKPPWLAPCPTGCRMAKVAILMALYNGERFLQAQLDSLLAQTHEDWALIASDDGSTDASPQMICDFAALNPERHIRLVAGPQQGVARNFLSLLSHVGDAAYFAFADQDDVWLPGKLSRAVAQMPEPDHPAMVCGRTTLVNEVLKKTGATLSYTRGASFGNALVQNIAGGNTMVLTRAALPGLLDARPYANNIIFHDWWAYQIMTGTGAEVIYDPEPQVLYRQHDDNLFGANRSVRARVLRFQMVMGGHFSTWNRKTVERLVPVIDHLTPENRPLLEAFRDGRGLPLFQRIALLRQARIRRQTSLGTIALWIAVILGRV